MVHTPINPETKTNTIQLPSTIALYITQNQFAALVEVNPDLRLERTAQGEFIVNPPLRSVCVATAFGVPPLASRLGNWRTEP